MKIFPSTKDCCDLQDIAELIGSSTTEEIKMKFAKSLGIEMNDDFVEKLDWLGLFDNVQVSIKSGTNSNLLVDLMLKKMAYEPILEEMETLGFSFKKETIMLDDNNNDL